MNDAETETTGALVVLLLSDDLATAAEISEFCAAQERRVVFVVAEFDYHDFTEIAGHAVKTPRDYLSSEECDAVYASVIDWQKHFAAHRLSSGATIDASSSPSEFAPALGSWLLRFSPHMHVRFRFIDFILKVIETERPSAICPVGRSLNQPWNMTLLNRILSVHAPEAELVSPVTVVAKDKQYDLWARTMDSAEKQHRDRRDGYEILKSFIDRNDKVLANAARAFELDGGSKESAKLSAYAEVIARRLLTPDVPDETFLGADQEARELFRERQLAQNIEHYAKWRKQGQWIMKILRKSEKLSSKVDRFQRKVDKLSVHVERRSKKLMKLNRALESRKTQLAKLDDLIEQRSAKLGKSASATERRASNTSTNGQNSV